MKVDTSVSMTGNKAERLWGDDRCKTAVAISRKGWEKSDTVILVDGNYFPDALVGSSFIYILGSNDSVSTAVEEEREFLILR